MGRQIERKREREGREGKRREGKGRGGKRWKDKLLLHHVFIRSDLGGRSGEAEDIAGEEPHHP